MCTSECTMYQLILLAAIFNWPINLFYPPDTAPVLISDKFPSFPSLPFHLTTTVQAEVYPAACTPWVTAVSPWDQNVSFCIPLFVCVYNLQGHLFTWRDNPSFLVYFHNIHSSVLFYFYINLKISFILIFVWPGHAKLSSNSRTLVTVLNNWDYT